MIHWEEKDMDKRRISRRQVLIGAGALGALGPFLGPATARADGEVGLLRWDLVAIKSAGTTTEVVAGGTNQGKDNATQDTVDVTGSGQANLDEGTAAGGGTFVHKHSDGTVVASGVYVVTGLRSFQHLGGSLVPAGLVDGIGHIAATTGGILSLDIHGFLASGGTVNAVLNVHCNLPGASPATEEGVVLTVSPAPGVTFHFTQNGGVTLFHILTD
jgi:hypothetical protein